MRLIFVRHGDPDYTIDSLTERGLYEAKLLGERAKEWKGDVERIYVSPLGRAGKTAEPVERALGQQAQVLDWLQEFRAVIDKKYGTTGIAWDFAPSYWTKVPELYDKDRWTTAEPMQPVEGKPGVDQVYRETCEGLDKLIGEYGCVRDGQFYRVTDRERSGKTIVLVCHMGITFVMLSHLLGIPFVPLMQGFYIPPTGVTVVNSEEVEEGILSFRCQGVGDVRHLYRNGQDISPRGYFGEIYQK